MTDNDSENGEWYVSGEHARRAIGYLGVSLSKHLPGDFEQPYLLDLWGEALEATTINDANSESVPSPIGA